jgi:hypothetical protein
MPERAAELFYALTDIKCNPDEIKIINLSDALSKNFINDIAIVAKGRTLLIIEHQSTINENMPLRILIYIGRILEQHLDLNEDKKPLHRKKLLKIPTPEFVVLYNGNSPLPEKTVLKLSDAFLAVRNPLVGNIELEVPVYNINKGIKNENTELIQKSLHLDHYATFVAKVKEYIKETKSAQKSVQMALEYCLENNILYDFFKEHGGDLVSLLEREYTIEDEKMGAWLDGKEEGREDGKIEIYFTELKYTVDKIAAKMNLPIEQVQQVLSSLNLI